MQNNNNTEFEIVKTKRGPGPRGQKVKDRQQQQEKKTQDKTEEKPRLKFKELLSEVNNLKKHQHSPKVDLKECTQQFYVRVELPGVSLNDIKIYVRDSTYLIISGNKLRDNTGENTLDIYSECNYGYFTRRVKVSSFITNIFDVNFENGILYVTLNKIKDDIKLDSRLEELTVEFEEKVDDKPKELAKDVIDFCILNSNDYLGSWADE
jgi:HSP20 family molecular chaperone IbpA